MGQIRSPEVYTKQNAIAVYAIKCVDEQCAITAIYFVPIACEMSLMLCEYEYVLHYGLGV